MSSLLKRIFNFVFKFVSLKQIGCTDRADEPDIPRGPRLGPRTQAVSGWKLWRRCDPIHLIKNNGHAVASHHPLRSVEGTVSAPGLSRLAHQTGNFWPSSRMMHTPVLTSGQRASFPPMIWLGRLLPLMKDAPPSLVGKGGHTLLLRVRGGRRGFNLRQ